jgi:hypothetical protein
MRRVASGHEGFSYRLFMTFEEQLTRAFETLTERLRGEIHQHVQRASAELVAAAPYDRDPAVIEAARQELELAVAAARRETHDAAWREAHEQGVAAGREAGRRDAQLEAATLPETGRDLERLAEATRAIDAAHSLTEMLDTLVAVTSQHAPGVALWLVRGGLLHRWRPAGADQAQAPTAQSPEEAGGPVAEAMVHNAAARDQHILAVPIALAGQVVAIFSADCASTEQPPPRPEYLELLVRYTAKSLESLTAFKTARALTQQAEPAAAPASAMAVDEAGEEDASARRYARLLVSEIKLYHESAVVEGRRDRDLASRLGGEIARARVMYDQRVPDHVRSRGDYFQDELVRTLANGDPSLLEPTTQHSPSQT